MNYKKFFSDELISLKSQGLYRKFRAINRNKSSFPKATERFEGKEREVEVINRERGGRITPISIFCDPPGSRQGWIHTHASYATRT